ncbi:hypothetical protein [Rhizobium sp. 11515TR]|uniref:hypothetical protein n=1 Tax=Rhizobium sp. 11515TR TaxID=2028343 RepID=UPI000BA83ABE|nr:hypothetical protein [Rhizobium sp. 11515TR]ASW04759.1 hypothetical protein CKA34_01795 [Rhizobium sp. 11515TR]
MVTKQITTVAIRNETGINFASIGVIHKYSDKYKQDKEWLNVANGAAPSDKLLVQYHTGFLTTGRDWWKILAYAEDGRIFQTSPANFRGVWDVAEKGLNKFGWAILTASAKAAGASGGVLAPLAGGVSVVTALLMVMSNSESTEGFKQFFLEEKDAPHGIEIILRPDEVEFKGIDSTATTPLVLGGYVQKVVS